MADQNFWGSEFFAALTGAAIGAVATFVSQQMAFKNERKKRQLERLADESRRKGEALERESVLALSILTKMNMALTTIADMHNHLHDAFIESIKRRMAFAAAMKSFSTDPKKFDFSLDELTLVRDLRHAELLNDMMDLPNTHAMYVDNMALFRKMRQETDKLGIVENVSTRGMATIAFTGDNAMRAQLNLKGLHDLQFALWRRSWDDLRRANNLMFDLQAALKNRLGRELLRVEFGMVRLTDPPPSDRHRRGIRYPNPAGTKIQK